MPDATPEVVLAFDFGLRRIGVAIGDTLTASARPLQAVHVDGSLNEADWQRLLELPRRHAARRIVVGCPYNVDGSVQALTMQAREFAHSLGTRSALPVHLVDERYSSLEAEQALRERRAAGTRRARIDRAAIDSAAAAVILERWFAGEGERRA